MPDQVRHDGGGRSYGFGLSACASEAVALPRFAGFGHAARRPAAGGLVGEAAV